MAIKLGPDRSPAETVGGASVETRRFGGAAIKALARRVVASVFSGKGGNSAPPINTSLGAFLNHANERTAQGANTIPGFVGNIEPAQPYHVGTQSFIDSVNPSGTSSDLRASATMEGHVGGPLSVFSKQTEPQVMPEAVKELINKATPADKKRQDSSRPETQTDATLEIDDQARYEDAVASGNDAALSEILGEAVRPGYAEALRQVTEEVIPAGPLHQPPEIKLLEQLLAGLRAKEWTDEPDTTATGQGHAITTQKQLRVSQAAIPGSGWFEESPSPKLYQEIIDGLKKQLPKDKIEGTDVADFLTGDQIIAEEDQVSTRALAAYTKNALQALEDPNFSWTTEPVALTDADDSPVYDQLQTTEKAGAGVFSKFKFAENVQIYLNGAREEVRELSESEPSTQALSLHLTKTTKSIDDFLAFDTSQGGMDIDGIVDGVMATYATTLHAKELTAEGIGDAETKMQIDELMSKMSDPAFFVKAMNVATSGEARFDQIKQYYMLHQFSQVLKTHNPQLMENPDAKQAYLNIARRINALSKQKREEDRLLANSK